MLHHKHRISSFRFQVWISAFCFLLSAFSQLSHAQSASDYAVPVTAVTQTSPNRITLSWPATPTATGYTVSRKLKEATAWSAPTSLPGTAINYIDSGVTGGFGYEYRVVKTAPSGTTSYKAYGYIYAGINLAPVTSRGGIVLLVDSTHAASLSNELTRLEWDLVGDGWSVLRHDVARNDSIQSIKNLITADYNTANAKALFILGHVPVPYSGEINPDGHPDHLGAWPADAWYGDMDGTWTDTTVNNTVASDPRNDNVPGDGKFDQDLMASTIELQVGRVDFYNLPAFALSELELLRQYLDKDHWFRHNSIPAQRRAIIDDNFGGFDGEAFAANGWRVFAPLLGPTNTIAADWLTTFCPRPSPPNPQPFLWGYGCGAGSYTSAGGVATTTDLATNDPQVVFTMMFGSYFGDWDSQNNFLRAQIATPSYTLTSAWAGRPYWIFHHTAMGETIGYSTRLTQNNAGTLYAANYCANWVHIALMGDPSLRLHSVSPPTALSAWPDDVGVFLSWTASPDAIDGYRIFRAPSIAGPYTNLTTSTLSATTYLDTQGTATSVYLVRAIKLEQTPSGTYHNLSQGIFQSLDASLTAPQVTLVRPTNNTILITPAEVSLLASEFDPSAAITNVAFYANGQLLGSDTTPPYAFVWANPPLGVFTMTAQANCANGLATNSPPFTLTIDNAAKPRLLISSLGDGTNSITGQTASAHLPARIHRHPSSQQLADPRLSHQQRWGLSIHRSRDEYAEVLSDGVPVTGGKDDPPSIRGYGTAGG